MNFSRCLYNGVLYNGVFIVCDWDWRGVRKIKFV